MNLTKNLNTSGRLLRLAIAIFLLGYTPSSSKAPKRIDSKPRGWITANGGSIEFNTTPLSGNSTARAFNSTLLGAFELEGVYAYWSGSWIALAAAIFTGFEALFSWCVVYQLLGKNSCPIHRNRK